MYTYILDNENFEKNQNFHLTIVVIMIIVDTNATEKQLKLEDPFGLSNNYNNCMIVLYSYGF